MPARAVSDPKHELGIWLPMALADIFTTMLASSGVKEIPSITDVLTTWQLGGLAKALASPVDTKPHKRGGIYGAEMAAMFAKELM